MKINKQEVVENNLNILESYYWENIAKNDEDEEGLERWLEETLTDDLYDIIKEALNK